VANSRDERMEIMRNCEAVIVMFSKESVLDDDSNHVIDDVRCAIEMVKPTIMPICGEGDAQ